MKSQARGVRYEHINRLTFEFWQGDAWLLDYEDYH